MRAAKLTLWCLLIGGPASAQVAPPACADDPAYSKLDFWIGEWSVQVEGREVGVNRITKRLDGCAVREEWTASGGGRGESLFYVVQATKVWRQVWVTGLATATGGLKEKELVEELAGGALRFQGEIVLPNGSTYLDRTTLTPLSSGSVRQHIEVSSNGGTTWRSVFDAEYVAVQPDSSFALPASVAWQDGPWPGVSVATIERDGNAITFWMRLPHGFWIMPHTHPSTKRINVIQGALRIAHGEHFDPAAGGLLRAGGFMVMPAETAHYEGAVGQTIVQFSVVGPFATNFVNEGPTYRQLP